MKNQALRSCISYVLIACILTISVPAGPEIAVQGTAPLAGSGVGSSWAGTVFESIRNYFPASVSSSGSPAQETQETRNARVLRIETNFPNTAYIESQIHLAAIPYDANDVSVSGVKLTWLVTKPNGDVLENLDYLLHFDSLGEYRITVNGANIQDTSTIFVVERPASLAVPENAKRKTSNSENFLLPFEEWNIDNIEHTLNPRNERGDAPGKPKENSNFNIIAPILSVAGRAGHDLNLNLVYNSKVWAKMGQDISYDMDKDSPAPGWSLGFGKVINFVQSGRILQIDPDGTRRVFSGSVTTGTHEVNFLGQSTDGSLIKAAVQTVGQTGNLPNICPSSLNAKFYYPNGTTVSYNAVRDPAGGPDCGSEFTLVPSQVKDKHGNYISIVNHHRSLPNTPLSPGKFIDYIVDTLGRIYKFNYTEQAGRHYLTSISGPGIKDENGLVTERTFARFNYKDHNLTYNFSGLTPKVRDNNNMVKVLSSVYYPGTNTGYWFGDADSYSPYGMIRKVQEHKGMGFDPATGSILAGQVTRERVYSYPTDTVTALTDMPEFNTVSETWDGMENPNSPAITEYIVDWNSSPRTTTVLAPYQSGKTKEYSFNNSSYSQTDPNKLLDGVAFKTEFYDGNGALVSKDEIDWVIGNGMPRPNSVTHTEFVNGSSLTKKSVNVSFGPYNRVLEMHETGYNGEILRVHKTQYQDINDNYPTATGHTSPRLVNLPTVVEVFDGNNNRIDYTKYTYDAVPQVNPFPPRPGSPGEYEIPPNFNYWGNFGSHGWLPVGNLSKTIKYSDVTSSSLGGEISDLQIYDRVGNVISYKPSAAVANTSSSYFTASTAYAYPETLVEGNESVASAKISLSTTYDYNTGLPLSVTDPNQQTATSKYEELTWRMKKYTSSTGAYTVFSFDDLNQVYSKTTHALGGQIVDKETAKLNRLGQPTLQESLTGYDQNGVEITTRVETQYDRLGRVKKQSTPFKSSQSESGVHWTEMTYDKIGRVEKTKNPDGSEQFTYYDEINRPAGASIGLGHTVRVKDPIGRERWHRTDSDGNIVEVIEPDPDGNGSVASRGLLTQYEYDRLSRLKRTTQGVQERNFKYDSLGRLTHQKMAEAKPTLDEEGNFHPDATGAWSNYIVYDELSNISETIDARGVKTVYSRINPALGNKDPLNRLFSISYELGQSTNVLPSPTVQYTYKTAGNVLLIASVYTEREVGGTPQRGVTYDFEYNLQGQLKDTITKLESRAQFPFVTSYTYDSIGRVTDILYPKQYGLNNNPVDPTEGSRKLLHMDFDSAGRASALKVDNINYASDFVYDESSRMTSVKIGPAGPNQVIEQYDYDPLTGLLENQKIVRNGTSLLDLNYSYQQCACSAGGSSQIKEIVNNLDRNKDKAYEYDRLGRLKKVTGGVNKTWSQIYIYDRYGNREGVTSQGFEALRQQSSISSREQEKLLNNAIPYDAPTKDGMLGDVKKQISAGNTGNIATDPAENEFRKIDTETKGGSNSKSRDTGGTLAGTNSTVPSEKNLSTHNFVNAARTAFDFDGDGKADFSTWGRSNHVWTVHKSGANGQAETLSLGANKNQIVPGDYDGDGKTDKATWNPETGSWVIKYSSDGSLGVTTWGVKGDAAVPSDYDGDGKTDLAVWRPSTGVWYVIKTTDGTWLTMAWGHQQNGDIPAVGDYDGDGRADFAVWRPTSTNWYAMILSSGGGTWYQVPYGEKGDVPVAADYDGDGKTDLTMWRPSNQTWYVQGTGSGFTATQLGNATDVLVPADYDGDGKVDPGVWSASTGTWTVRQSTTGTNISYQLGTGGDVAVPSAYIRRSSAPKGQSVEIARDGHQSLSFEAASNRIITTGFEYDLAGNQIQTLGINGSVLHHLYDAAGRLIKVKNANQQTLETYTYGIGRERLVTHRGDENSIDKRYYAWNSGAVVAEYVDSASNALVWVKNSVFLGGALLATQEKSSSGEKVKFYHPDQLGTRVVTDPSDGTSFEQNTLPFGTALESESTDSIGRRFTSFDRSSVTKLDYATNRFYDASQGRFTQPDPIGMASASASDPQSLNLYNYTRNDPINRTDPTGLDDNGPVIRIHTWTWGPSPPAPTTGSSIFSGLTFNFGSLGNLFGGGNSYAGTFGIPTYFWQLNTASLTPAFPTIGPTTKTLSESRSTTSEYTDYNSADCSKKVLDFLGSYAASELGSLAANAADYVNPLLAYMQGFSAGVREVTFAVANAYHETQLFNKFVEPTSKLSRDYDGGDPYRGRGYIHLTGKGTYQAIEDHLWKNKKRWGFLPFLVQAPDIAAEISTALKLQTAYFDMKGTFSALNSGSYLDARKTINPGESLNKRIGPKPKGTDTRPTIQQRITGLTTGLEGILKGC